MHSPLVAFSFELCGLFNCRHAAAAAFDAAYAVQEVCNSPPAALTSGRAAVICLGTLVAWLFFICYWVVH